MLKMDSIVNLKASQINFDVTWDMVNVRNDFQSVVDNIQHTATLDSRRCQFIDELYRNRNGNFCPFGNTVRIHMQWAVGDRMKLDSTSQGFFFFALKGEFEHF